MTILKIESFTGEIPRTPPHMLPENAATEAVNCDFAHGELRPLRGLGVVKSTTAAVRSVFSDDGLRFFAWGKPTRAYLSPTIDDTLERVYFANDDGFLVTRISQMKLHDFGPPVESWRVGLPVPGVPTITLQDGASEVTVTLQKEDGATVTPVSATVEVVEPGREYLFTLDEGSGDAGAGGASSGAVAVGGTLTVTGLEMVLTGLSYDSGEGGSGAASASPFGSLVRVGLPAQNTLLGFSQESMVPFPLNEPFTITVLGPDTVFADAGRDRVGLTIQTAHYANVTSVRYNGEWVPLQSLIIADAASGGAGGADGPIIAKVQAEGWVAYSEGGFAPSSRTDVQVSALPEGDDKIRVKITYAGKRYVGYVVTFTNDWLEESAPSSPVMVELDELQGVQISASYTPFTNGRPILGMNVYRTYGTGSAFVLVNSAPVQSPFDDTSTEPQTATTLETTDWDPPHANIKNLTYVGNGFFAGSVGKDLYFSEPYHPHAWPYAMTFPQGIAGVESIEGGLLVTTYSGCYTVMGAHPEQMSQQVVTAEQAGISGRAMTRVGSNAIFVSNDGLVEVAGGRASIQSSQTLFTRKDWRDAYLPDFQNLVLGAHDGAIVGIVDPSYPSASSADAGSFIIRLDEAGGTYTRLDLGNDKPLGCSLVPVVDAMYVGQGTGFSEFGAGNPLNFIWASRDFTFSAPTIFGAVIVGGKGALKVEVFGDGELIHTQDLPLDEYKEGFFRLPAVGGKKVWKVRLSGTGTVRKFEMATSYGELKRG